MVRPPEQRLLTEANADTVVAAHAGTPGSALGTALNATIASTVPPIVADVVANDPTVTAEAAALAQSDAGLLRKTDTGAPDTITSDNVLVAITDANNRETFLTASASDGGPTDHAANLIAARMTPARLGHGVEKPQVEDVLGGLVDANDNQTWLMARASDGGPTSRAVRQIANRTGGARTIVGVGDSLTAGGEWLARAATILGSPTVNLGVAGQTTTEISIRQGATTPTLTVTGDTIPTYGPVDVTAISPSSSYREGGATSVAFTYRGTLAGVLGTLTQYSNEIPLRRTFTRTAGGPAVTCPPGTPFYATQGTAHKLGVQVIWAGRNNIGDLNNVLRDIAAMVANLGTDARYLVLSVTNGQAEPSGSTPYNQIKAINDALAATYGNRYLNVRKYLIDYGLQDAGLAPTAEDTTAIGEDRIPPALHSDSIHFTTAGSQAVGNCIAAKIATEGWIN